MHRVGKKGQRRDRWSEASGDDIWIRSSKRAQTTRPSGARPFQKDRQKRSPEAQACLVCMKKRSDEASGVGASKVKSSR